MSFFFSLASMWLLLSYMNDDLFLCLREVKVTVCCKASIPKQNCKTCNYHFDFCWKMYINMAFLFVYVFLARAHFLCYIFPNKYWKLVDILDMAQGLVKYKVGYELHCGEKELAFFCILVYVPFYVYILFFLKLLLNVIDFSFWIHLLRDFFSVRKKKNVRFRNDSWVRNAWSDYVSVSQSTSMVNDWIPISSLSEYLKLLNGPRLWDDVTLHYWRLKRHPSFLTLRHQK